ncbi:hypothetical protein, partial [Microcoleus sp. MON2_D5]|uniref:hypothetical protein n=1 Tax=Microcoleus sp. MON2_D5 TaxID=2818833 RepID=UPI002FCEDB7B
SYHQWQTLLSNSSLNLLHPFLQGTTQKVCIILDESLDRPFAKKITLPNLQARITIRHNEIVQNKSST